jgi:hypothetical protein
MSVLHAAILQLHLYDGGSRKKEGSPHIYPFVYWLKQDVQGVSSPLLDLSTVLYFGFIFSLPCSSRFWWIIDVAYNALNIVSYEISNETIN